MRIRAAIDIESSAEHRQLTGRNRGFWGGRLFSFRSALRGAAYTLRTQPNAWIEIAALAVVGAAGLYFRVSALEWGLLGLTIFLVLALEAVNTAVEATIDLMSPHYHPLAKIAKDAAAGGLVFAVLGSLCMAAAIFGPRLWALGQSALK
jgi:diacylglycerol kinase (ATP)